MTGKKQQQQQKRLLGITLTFLDALNAAAAAATDWDCLLGNFKTFVWSIPTSTYINTWLKTRIVFSLYVCNHKVYCDFSTCEFTYLPNSKPLANYHLILPVSFVTPDLSPLWLLLCGTEQICDKPLQPEECNFKIGTWLEWIRWSLQWYCTSNRQHWDVRKHLRMGAKKAVTFNCKKTAWEMSLWITATINQMGMLTERHKFRQTNTYTLCIWIKSKRRAGASKLVYMQISLHWGDENSKDMEKHLLFLPSDKYDIGYTKAVCCQQQLSDSSLVGSSLSIYDLSLHRFAGSARYESYPTQLFKQI